MSDATPHTLPDEPAAEVGGAGGGGADTAEGEGGADTDGATAGGADRAGGAGGSAMRRVLHETPFQ